MKRFSLVLLLPSLALLSACATGPDTGPMAGERYALILTDVSRRAERIFPVEIYRIDDQEIRDPRGQRPIEPGVHTIRARGIVNRDLVPGLTRDLSRGGPQEITVNFQSGYRYFLGLKADSPRREDWELVVWKIEEVEAGMVKLED